MPVIHTKEWLEDYLSKSENRSVRDLPYIQLDTLCRPLEDTFKPAHAEEIHMHLIENGMFQPVKETIKTVESLVGSDLWQRVEKEYHQLKREWNGPDIELFLLPADTQNPMLKREFNNKSGLSYSDKLFLFVTDRISPDELKALITHEYHHVCRLSKGKKGEEELTLLDSIILEGLAEYAVKERVGEDQLAIWATVYPKSTAIRFWNRFLLPHHDIGMTNRLHKKLLYGIKPFPKWIGYNAGYRIVESYAGKEEKESIDLFQVNSEDILKGSEFPLKR